jgi:hypothetical protein
MDIVNHSRGDLTFVRSVLQSHDRLLELVTGGCLLRLIFASLRNLALLVLRRLRRLRVFDRHLCLYRLLDFRFYLLNFWLCSALWFLAGLRLRYHSGDLVNA